MFQFFQNFISFHTNFLLSARSVSVIFSFTSFSIFSAIWTSCLIVHGDTPIFCAVSSEKVPRGEIVSARYCLSPIFYL